MSSNNIENNNETKEEILEIKSKDAKNNSSLKNSKFEGLTSEQIIKKYEEVLNSREKQFYDLSKERGKLSQKIKTLEEKKEKSKYNNDKLKEIFSKYDSILKKELRNKEFEFMKLTNLENKYDDLQNKIDYIINKQNALAESSRRKRDKKNNDTEEIMKLKDKTPEIIKEANNNIISEEKNILKEETKEEIKEEKEIIKEDEKDNKIEEKVETNNNKEIQLIEIEKKEEKKNEKIEEKKNERKEENQNKKENKNISARERLNKLKEKKGKVQKLNFSDFINHTNSSDNNI